MVGEALYLGCGLSVPCSSRLCTPPDNQQSRDVVILIVHLAIDYELGSRYRFGVVADRQAPTLHFPGSKPIFFRRFITPTSEMVSMYKRSLTRLQFCHSERSEESVSPRSCVRDEILGFAQWCILQVRVHKPIGFCHSERSEESRPSRMILGIRILRFAQCFANEEVAVNELMKRLSF